MTAAAEVDDAFAEAFATVFGPAFRPADDDGPGTLADWDSLAQVRLVHALETRLGLRLPDEALLEEQTVGSLKRLAREQAE